ncbi:MAG: TonB-dependent receptor [Sphingorhabdus sp.]
MENLSKALLKSGSALALLVCAQSAFAQDVTAPSSDPAPAEAADNGDEIFGDIVVTAQKRDQNLRDVPVSISAFSGDQLKRLGISNTADITQQIPGMHINAWSPNVTIFNLRGISQNNFTDYLEAPVAVYTDNAYMGSINGISGQLFDIQRVEVLRGPQGTLFGRNATGGLVHYLSHPAKENELNGYVEGSYGRFDQRSLEGAVGGAITDGWRARLSMRRAMGGNYMKAADADPGNGLFGDGQDIGGQNAFSLRATTQIDVTPDLMVELWYKYSNDSDVATGAYSFENCVFQANGYCHVNSAGLTDGPGGVINGITGAPASPYDNFSGTPGHLDRQVHIGQANITWKLGGVDLTSITNFTTLKKDYLEDGDGLPIQVIDFGTTAKYDQFSQELRLSGDSGPLKWQVGAYFLDMRTKGTMTTVGAPVIGAALDLNGAANSPSVLEEYNLVSKNWSVFGQGEYQFTDKFSLIAGLRYSKDTKSMDYISTLIDTGFANQTLATDETFSSQVPGANRISHGDYAARVSLNYKPNSDMLFFASYNRGIKGGNWTLSPTVTADLFQHKPETLHSFELGTKLSTADQKLRVNATLFHYVYEDYQAFAIIGGTPQVSNSDARATGAELEVTWAPVRHLNMMLGASWETSKVDTVRAAGQQIGPEFFPGAPDAQYCTNIGGAFQCTYPDATVTNAEFPNAPKFSLNYLMRYDFDVAGGEGAVQIDGAWYDKQFLEVTNGASSLQSAYNVTNGSISWTDPSGMFDLSLWSKNIFNQQFRAYTLNLGILGTTAYYAPPTTYGATLRINW